MSGGYLQYFLFLLGRPEPIRQSSLLMVLASGIDDGHVLTRGLRSLAEESRGRYANGVQALAEALEGGHGLSEALMLAPSLLPEQTVIAIRAAEQTGTLRQILADEALRLTTSQSTAGVTTSPFLVLCWLWLVGAIGLHLVSFMMIWIVPKMRRIFDDFDIELPDQTLAFFSLTDFLYAYWLFFLLPAMTIIAVTFGQMFWWRYQWLSLGRIVYAEHFTRWQTPMILRLLGVSVAAGTRMTDTLHAILIEMRPGRAARRLSSARQRMEGGEDTWDALHHEGFLTSREVAFLHSAQKTSHLDWGLMHLSRSFGKRRERLTTRLTSILIPVAVLSMGAIVLIIAVGMFMPLITLINETAEY